MKKKSLTNFVEFDFSHAADRLKAFGATIASATARHPVVCQERRNSPKSQHLRDREDDLVSHFRPNYFLSDGWREAFDTRTLGSDHLDAAIASKKPLFSPQTHINATATLCQHRVETANRLHDSKGNPIAEHRLHTELSANLSTLWANGLRGRTTFTETRPLHVWLFSQQPQQQRKHHDRISRRHLTTAATSRPSANR